MGILNLTPDSFSDGGKLSTPEAALERALNLESSGADILDLGAESTRPGATRIELEEEWRRLEPVLKLLSNRVAIPLSIDTYKPEIARRAVQYGVEIINDVSGGQWTDGMWKTVAAHQLGYVLTHSQGTPSTMQNEPSYGNVLPEIVDFLQKKILACQVEGVFLDRLVVDPGIGFGKTTEHNLTILARLGELKEVGRPLLVGVSRKSFLKKIAGEEAIEVSTLTAQIWAAANGAAIWRVHDVSAAVAAALMIKQLRQNELMKP